VFGCGSVSSESSSDSENQSTTAGTTALQSIVAETKEQNHHHHHHHKKKMKAIKAMDPNSYQAKRDRLKKKIVEDVLKKALPDKGTYDVNSIISGPKKRWSGWYLDCIKICGCMTLTLHECVRYGSVKSLNRTIKTLTKSKTLKSEIDSPDLDGRTPLICAIVSRRSEKVNPTELVDILLTAGADVNVPDSFNGMTPLHYAIIARDEKLVTDILGRGAFVNMADLRCVTPLMMAVSNNLALASMVMINKLAELDAVDENGWSALHYAAYAGYPKCVKVLVNNAADRYLRDNNKRRPLHIARFRDDVIKKNPPITKAERAALLNVNHGECIAALEDAKSRIAQADGDLDF